MRADVKPKDISQIAKDGPMMKNYRKKGVQPMRPYVPGEDLTGVSVAAVDTPEQGGMIAVNPKNPADKWYIAAKYFEDNYEEA